MPHVFAQIVHVGGPDIGDVTDWPAPCRGNIPGRPKERRIESLWASDLMLAYDEWRSVVDLEPAVRIETERTIAAAVGINPRSIGMPRADAVAFHADGRVSILEVKVKPGATEAMNAIGQLLHYRIAIERYEGMSVAALVLATPYLPPLVLDCIANFRLPIRVLKARGSMFSGIVPDHVAKADANC